MPSNSQDWAIAKREMLVIGSVTAGGRINSSLALIAWFDQIQSFFRGWTA